MKKILIFILGIFGIGLSFCSAGEITINGIVSSSSTLYAGTSFGGIRSPFSSTGTFSYDCSFSNFNGTVSDSTNIKFKFFDSSMSSSTLNTFSSSVFRDGLGISGYSFYGLSIPVYFAFTLGVSNSTSFSFDYSCVFSGSGISEGGSSSCPDQLIDVQYSSGNTSTITCDGINYISIDGLSTLTNSDVNYEYTPYFNIDYKDEDNQSLIESYSNSILYLSGGLFKKTYTGDNDWILSIQGNSNSQFTGYIPVFDVTGSTDILDNGNVFNNFSDNALKVLLSNIPSYIQYITIFFILLFLFGFIRRFKRK